MQMSRKITKSVTFQFACVVMMCVQCFCSFFRVVVHVSLLACSEVSFLSSFLFFRRFALVVVVGVFVVCCALLLGKDQCTWSN